MTQPHNYYILVYKPITIQFVYLILNLPIGFTQSLGAFWIISKFAANHLISLFFQSTGE